MRGKRSTATTAWAAHGDCERNDYIGKFVAAKPCLPTKRAANRHLLDEGTLHAAGFDADLTGAWMALTPGAIDKNGVALRDSPNLGGADDAEVLAKILIKTRMVAGAMGATMMDCSEWTGGRPHIRWLRRGRGRGQGRLHVDQQQPPSRQAACHRYGGQRSERQLRRRFGALGDWINIGSNVMVCCNPNTGETRRSMTSLDNRELTVVTMTPDGKTMCPGIQHPGEDGTAANPSRFSNWPQGQFAVESDGMTTLPPGRPRSSLVVITKNDRDVIGS